MIKLDVKKYTEKEYLKVRNSPKFAERPILDIIQIGNSDASNKYVGNKIKKCDEYGISTILTKFNGTDYKKTEHSVLEIIRGRRSKKIIQLPVPSELSNLPSFLNSDEDVDGLVDYNVVRLDNGELDEYLNIPCTARGIAEYMHFIDKDLKGKTALIVGRSALVGKPLSKLLSIMDMTVLMANSHTPKKRLEELCKIADYVIVAVGKHGVVTSSMIGDNTTVIDVGINFDKNGKMEGDFKIMEKDHNKNFRYTPVPNGVGQLTVLSLIKNIYEIPIKIKG